MKHHELCDLDSNSGSAWLKGCILLGPGETASLLCFFYLLHDPRSVVDFQKKSFQIGSVFVCGILADLQTGRFSLISLKIRWFEIRPRVGSAKFTKIWTFELKEFQRFGFKFFCVWIRIDSSWVDMAKKTRDFVFPHLALNSSINIYQWLSICPVLGKR